MTDPVKPTVEQPKVEPPKPTQLPAEKVNKEAEKEKGDLLKKIGEILKEHDNRESDIPLSHEYWNLVNRFRGL